MPYSVQTYLRFILPGTAIGLLLYAIAYPLRRRRLARRGLRSPASREGLLFLFTAYCGGMAMLTLTPPLFDLFAVLQGRLRVPFFAMGTFNFKLFSTFRLGVGMMLGNVILFMPFTFCAAVLWRGGKWYHALAVAVGVTVFIESWQHFVGRVSEIDDLLLNTAGGILGWLLWLALRRPTLYCEEK